MRKFCKFFISEVSLIKHIANDKGIVTAKLLQDANIDSSGTSGTFAHITA